MLQKLRDTLADGRRAGYLAAALITLWAGCISAVMLDDLIFSKQRSKPLNEAALLEIRNSIQPGDNHEEVLRAFWKHSPKTRLEIKPYSADRWVISTPSDIILSNNWVLYIDFRDDKIIGHRIRTSDGPHPSRAPEDIGENSD